MTSLAVAVAKDSRGPCGLYILTDSRITWNSPQTRWDAGCKTFASKVSPDIFAYCGDAYFAPMILSQAINLFELGLPATQALSAQERHGLILGAMKRSMASVTFKNPVDTTFFHGSRSHELMKSRFHMWRSTYHPATGLWEEKEYTILYQSYLVTTDGTGRTAVRSSMTAQADSLAGSTSRSVVYAFCQSLAGKADPYSGGPPQMVGLWRNGVGRNFGMYWDDRPFVGGMEVSRPIAPEALACFNGMFERCDPNTGVLLPGAKSHALSLTTIKVDFQDA